MDMASGEDQDDEISRGLQSPKGKEVAVEQVQEERGFERGARGNCGTGQEWTVWTMNSEQAQKNKDKKTKKQRNRGNAAANTQTQTPEPRTSQKVITLPAGLLRSQRRSL